MLETFKEYKELIGIVIFFLAGFFWLENKYPTKEDLKSEVAVLGCLLDKYMEITQLQMSSQQLEKQVDELKHQISLYSEAQNLPPAVKQALEEKNLELATDKKYLRENKTRIDILMRELERNSCGKRA